MYTKQTLRTEFEKEFGTFNYNGLRDTDILAFFLARIPDIVKELMGEEEKITCDLPQIVKMCDKCEESIIRNALRQEIITNLTEWGK